MYVSKKGNLPEDTLPTSIIVSTENISTKKTPIFQHTFIYVKISKNKSEVVSVNIVVYKVHFSISEIQECLFTYEMVALHYELQVIVRETYP